MAAREAPSEDEDRSRFIQNVLQMETAQLPLASPEVDASVQRQFAEPSKGETVVLLKTADVTVAYAVGSSPKPRPVTPGQLIMAVECGPGEPTKPLPDDTNARVMAAFEHFQHDVSSRLGKARRAGGDTRLRRYLAKQFNLTREAHKDDPAELQRIGVLQRIFFDHVPANVLAELTEVRKMELEGVGFIRRLEALRLHFKLNPPDPDEDQAESPSADVIRTICSDGLE